MNTEKMSQSLQTAMELLQTAEELRPVISSAITALNSYGPELNDLLLKMAIGTANIRMTTIKHYESNGFTKEEAMLMTLDSKVAMKEAMSSINKK